MQNPRLLVVFVDALGPAQVAHFDRLHFVPHRRSLKGVIGYSSGALPTLLTGSPPAAHGRMCLFSAAPGPEPGVLRPLRWLGLLPAWLHERPFLRRRLARLFSHSAGITGYVALHRVPPAAFEWLDLPEREDLFEASEIGGERTFLGDARAAGLQVYSGPWRLPEAERWEHAHETLSRQLPDLSFLYSADLDGALHQAGNDATTTVETLSRIADGIERARDALGSDGRPVVTLIVGDHGMADVNAVIDPRPLTRRLAGIRVFVDSTMLRFWAEAPTLESARKEIEAQGWPGRWLDEADLRARSAPVLGSPFGRALYLLPEGSIFAPSWVGGAMAGMHGYDLGCSSARALLASDAPIPEDCDALQSVASLVRGHLGLG
jgi:hypothetical protein